MSPAAARGRHRPSPRRTAAVRPRLRGGARRRLAVLAELVVAVGICLAGYEWGAAWLRVHEAAWVVAAMRAIGVDQVSAVLPGHILAFRADGSMLNGEVTTSCSSILTVVGLTALTVAVLRRRRLHALGGLLVALAAVIVSNDLRLTASTFAGLWWGQPAMILFHDWVGTLWTFAATLGGFLIMVCITLPTAIRAEQDVAGRHTARRPDGWAQPGLGYRSSEETARAGGRRRTLTGLMHRYVLPRSVSRRLAAKREAGRVDYRIGHLPAAERVATVRALVSDGLGAHTASLLAVAAHDEDPAVLDALAEAVAGRQWEPVTNERIAALRLWARGWLLRRRSGTDPTATDDVTAPTGATAGDHAPTDDMPTDGTGSVTALRERPPVPVPVARPVPAQAPPAPVVPAPPAPTPPAPVPPAPVPPAAAIRRAVARRRRISTAPRNFARPDRGTGTTPVEETP